MFTSSACLVAFARSSASVESTQNVMTESAAAVTTVRSSLLITKAQIYAPSVGIRDLKETKEHEPCPRGYPYSQHDLPVVRSTTSADH